MIFQLTHACQSSELVNTGLWSHPEVILKPEVNWSSLSWPSCSLPYLLIHSCSALSQIPGAIMLCLRCSASPAQLHRARLKPVQGSYLAQGTAHVCSYRWHYRCLSDCVSPWTWIPTNIRGLYSTAETRKQS